MFLQIFITEKKNLWNHGLFEGCWQVFLVISVMENKLIDHPSSFLPVLGTLGATRWVFKTMVYAIGTPHVWPAKKMMKFTWE